MRPRLKFSSGRDFYKSCVLWFVQAVLIAVFALIAVRSKAEIPDDFKMPEGYTPPQMTFRSIDLQLFKWGALQVHPSFSKDDLTGELDAFLRQIESNDQIFSLPAALTQDQERQKIIAEYSARRTLSTLFVFSQILPEIIERDVQRAASGKAAHLRDQVAKTTATQLGQCAQYLLDNWSELASSGRYGESRHLVKVLYNQISSEIGKNESRAECYQALQGLIGPKSSSSVPGQFLELLLRAEAEFVISQQQLAQLRATRVLTALSGDQYPQTVRSLAAYFMEQTSPEIQEEARQILRGVDRWALVRNVLNYFRPDVLQTAGAGAVGVLQARRALSALSVKAAERVRRMDGIVLSIGAHAAAAYSVTRAAAAPFSDWKIRNESGQAQPSKSEDAVTSLARDLRFDLLSKPLLIEWALRKRVQFLRSRTPLIELGHFVLQAELQGANADTLKIAQVLHQMMDAAIEAAKGPLADRSPTQIQRIERARVAVKKVIQFDRYAAYQPHLIPFMLDTGGNCISDTLFLGGAFAAHQSHFDKNWILAFEHMPNHIQAVAYNRDTDLAFDLNTGGAKADRHSLIYNPSMVLEGFLRAQASSVESIRKKSWSSYLEALMPPPQGPILSRIAWRTVLRSALSMIDRAGVRNWQQNRFLAWPVFVPIKGNAQDGTGPANPHTSTRASSEFHIHQDEGSPEQELAQRAQADSRNAPDQAGGQAAASGNAERLILQKMDPAIEQMINQKLDELLKLGESRRAEEFGRRIRGQQRDPQVEQVQQAARVRGVQLSPEIARKLIQLGLLASEDGDGSRTSTDLEQADMARLLDRYLDAARRGQSLRAQRTPLPSVQQQKKPMNVILWSPRDEASPSERRSLSQGPTFSLGQTVSEGDRLTELTLKFNSDQTRDDFARLGTKADQLKFLYSYLKDPVLSRLEVLNKLKQFFFQQKALSPATIQSISGSDTNWHFQAMMTAFVQFGTERYGVYSPQFIVDQIDLNNFLEIEKFVDSFPDIKRLWLEEEQLKLSLAREPEVFFQRVSRLSISANRALGAFFTGLPHWDRITLFSYAKNPILVKSGPWFKAIRDERLKTSWLSQLIADNATIELSSALLDALSDSRRIGVTEKIVPLSEASTPPVVEMPKGNTPAPKNRLTLVSPLSPSMQTSRCAGAEETDQCRKQQIVFINLDQPRAYITPEQFVLHSFDLLGAAKYLIGSYSPNQTEVTRQKMRDARAKLVSRLLKSEMQVLVVDVVQSNVATEAKRVRAARFTNEREFSEFMRDDDSIWYLQGLNGITRWHELLENDIVAGSTQVERLRLTTESSGSGTRRVVERQKLPSTPLMARAYTCLLDQKEEEERAKYWINGPPSEEAQRKQREQLFSDLRRLRAAIERRARELEQEVSCLEAAKNN